MISCYDHIKNPLVVEEIDIYDFLDRIINPDPEILESINEARTSYKSGNKDIYNSIKLTLPCFTLNFSFHERKLNKKIKAPTGFIYIDVDNPRPIDLTNPLIFACWRSLSESGYGVLVKVNGLSLDNFKYTYDEISEELGLDSDNRARRATQYTIQSYDKDIYINEDSTTWIAKELKRGHSVTYIKEEKDTTEWTTFDKVKYDNLDLIDFDGEPYIFFPDEKEMTAKLWIPQEIKKGSRNETLASIAYQFRALNPTMSYEAFESFILKVNSSRCKPPLDEEEVFPIIRRIDKTDILNPLLNKPRRIIFNPDFNFTKKEKIEISNRLNGERKSEKTREKINMVLKNWDFDKNGKVTQKKIAELSGTSPSTVKRHLNKIKSLLKQSI